MNKTILFFLQCTAVLGVIDAEWWKTFEPRLIDMEVRRIVLSPDNERRFESAARNKGLPYPATRDRIIRDFAKVKVDALLMAMSSAKVNNLRFNHFLQETSNSLYLAAEVRKNREEKYGFRIIWDNSKEVFRNTRFANGFHYLREKGVTGAQISMYVECTFQEYLNIYACIHSLEFGYPATQPMFKPLNAPVEPTTEVRQLSSDQKRLNNISLLGIFVQILQTLSEFHNRAGCFHGAIVPHNLFWLKVGDHWQVTVGGYEGLDCPNNPIKIDRGIVPHPEQAKDCFDIAKEFLFGKKDLNDKEFDTPRAKDYVDTGAALRQILELNKAELDFEDKVGVELQSIAESLANEASGNPQTLTSAIKLAQSLQEKFGPKDKTPLKII